MPRKHRIALASFLLATSVAASAQIMQFGTPKRSSASVGINNVTAPIPTPLLSGRKAFISYELGDVIAFPDIYSGGPERAYGELYSGMKSWGRYDLVSDPKDADVIFAVRFAVSVNTPPQVRLSILDAKTQIALWGFVEQVDFKFRKKNRDAAFTDSVRLLVADIRTLVGQSTFAPPGPAQP